MKKLLLLLTLIAPLSTAALDLSDYVGYQVIYSGYITGYQDRGKKAVTDWTFEGCDYDRVIFLDDRYAVYCKNYSYSYSYHPRVAIISNGNDVKMIVNDQSFDVSLREY